MESAVRVSRSLQAKRWFHIGFVILSALLGATSFFVVAPQASGLGLIAADPISLAVCAGFAVVYGVASNKLVVQRGWQLSGFAALSFLLGSFSMVWVYPAEERFATPSTKITTSPRHYVERCVIGFDQKDRVEVSPRAKLFFDLFQPAQWLITIWFHDRGGSYSFHAKTSDLQVDCLTSLVIPDR